MISNPWAQLQRFFELASERKLAGSDQLVYLHLFNLFDRAHFPESIFVNDATLLERCRLYGANGAPASNETLRRAKQRLKGRHFIDFKPGTGKTISEYRLIEFQPGARLAEELADIHHPVGTPVGTPVGNPDGTPVGAGSISCAPKARARADLLNPNLADFSSPPPTPPTNFPPPTPPTRVRDYPELETILEYWENAGGAWLTTDHVDGLLALVHAYGREWVLYALKETSDANSNPKGISFKFFKAVVDRLLKGGEKIEKRDDQTISSSLSTNYPWDNEEN